MTELNNQPQETEVKRDLMAEARAKAKAEEEAKRHSYFIEGLEGKTFSEMCLAEQDYIYKNYKKTYEKLVEDKSQRLTDIKTLERLKPKKTIEDIREEAKAKIEQETKSDFDLESFIDNSINELFANFNF